MEHTLLRLPHCKDVRYLVQVDFHIFVTHRDVERVCEWAVMMGYHDIIEFGDEWFGRVKILWMSFWGTVKIYKITKLQVE